MYVIKKDGTKEEFNVDKIIAAVNKSASRIMYRFTEKEISFICEYAKEKAKERSEDGITIPEMKEAIVRHIAEVRQQKQAAGVTSTGPQGRGSAGEDRGGRKMRNVILAQMREEYRAVAARYLPA